MTGRGIDQILQNPCDPILYQSNYKNAQDYLKLAEKANGPILKPADFSYIWGDSIEIMENLQTDLRIINLETSITTSQDFVKDKPVHYRMNPANISCLTAAKVNICVAANNHILDWGIEGLVETLNTLKKAKIKFAGAGHNKNEAEDAIRMEVEGKGRLILFSFCSPCSGVPLEWAADKNKSGVNLIPDLSEKTIQFIKAKVKSVKQPHDVIIASIHWGNNWGYHIPYKQRKFAHSLIDEADVDLVYGHSSHHPRPLEVYKEKLIIYGAGDLINDYEGIPKNKKFRMDLRKLRQPWKIFKILRKKNFRADLVLMYFVTVDPFTGKLKKLLAVPMQIKKFRLNYPSSSDIDWLKNRMNKIYKKFNLRLEKYCLASNINSSIFILKYAE